MKPQELLLLRRRRRRAIEQMADSSDGLMDVLSNVVGVMALVGSLTGVFAATSSLNIQAPMQERQTVTFGCFRRQKMVSGIYSLQ